MSYEEEAHWWETHDTSDYQDEFVATDIEFKLAPEARIDTNTRRLYEEIVSENLEKTVAVRFTHRDYESLRKEARDNDLKMATLIRRWALEKLRRVEGGNPRTT